MDKIRKHNLDEDAMGLNQPKLIFYKIVRPYTIKENTKV